MHDSPRRQARRRTLTDAFARVTEPAEAALLPAAELGESRVLPALAVVAAAALYATLPSRFVAGSSGFLGVVRWVVPALAVALLPPLVLTAPKRRLVFSVRRRTAAIALISIMSAASAASIVLLVHEIVNGRTINGHELVRAAIHIWCTSVLLFALWFWQLDSGGPMERRRRRGTSPDFLFPQLATPSFAPPNWQPQFLDYLYLSFTNSTAFSPTDTMPLSRWAKMLMLVESAASLLLLVMVAARAVNILS
jgi:uncharacterized membrane protein